MTDGFVSILDGNTFVVSDGRGDIRPTEGMPTGLFSFDTRFVSTWTLTLNGERLSPLSVDDMQFFETRFFLVPGAATHYVNAKISVIRHRWVGASFNEEVTVLNHGERPAEIRVRLEIGADFADLAVINEPQQKKTGRLRHEITENSLRLIYERETYHRATVVSTTSPASIDPNGMTFDVVIEPQGSWGTSLHVESMMLGSRHQDLRLTIDPMQGRDRRRMRQELREWLDRAPRLSGSSDQLDRTYQRSLVDLAALRYRELTSTFRVPVAGLPWSATLFGRDSILTALQALPFTPELAPETLRFLGALQGTRIDDFREEEPGRIPHEVRYGESAAFEELPHAPYFGSVDATPLFVVLLDEYERWSGDVDLVRELEHETRAALTWLDEYADLMGNGYVWYERRNTRSGRENQCWKDSWDAISYPDGRLPSFPRATCEVQGYAYDAKLRGARLARLVWNDPALADRLEREAAELKERFNRDFWVADGEFYALALDGDGRQVDTLSSNIGHLLWSGIVPPERAGKIAEHLVGARLFSGWGVRTLTEGSARYNPIGYHVGTVWPFDNSFIAWGLRRYGFAEEAATIAESMIEAAQYFHGRLPSHFCGYDRALTKYPVRYPGAGSPQAFSAGAPLLLLRTMLGLEPHEGHLAVEPALPEGLGRVELLDIPGRWGRQDAFARGRVEVR
ncbi:glycogen debranching N-terminal domain-containing protein [Micromonospora sp. NPDC049559]|uniref:amylo-alpha-1,6-glucosidase n=1 Tax=Micromonospora sp. NPDC049559 TaxID=3155923 RepID=UPI003449590D